MDLLEGGAKGRANREVPGIATRLKSDVGSCGTRQLEVCIIDRLRSLILMKLCSQLFLESFAMQQNEISSLSCGLAQLQATSSQVVVTTETILANERTRRMKLQHEVERASSSIANPLYRMGFQQLAGQASERASYDTQHLESHDAVKVKGVVTTGSKILSRKASDKRVWMGSEYTAGSSFFGSYAVKTDTWAQSSSRGKEIEELEEDDFERKTTIKIHPADWLIRLGLNIALRLAVGHTSCGWQQTLETYRVVPFSAPIFEACREGELTVVQELFARGKASLWDRNPNGEGPLYVSIQELSENLRLMSKSIPSSHLGTLVPKFAGSSLTKEPPLVILANLLGSNYIISSDRLALGQKTTLIVQSRQ